MDSRGARRIRAGPAETQGAPLKVLVLVDRIPFPLTNGQNLRIFHYVKKLKDRHDFTLISYGKPPYPPEIDRLFRAIRTLDERPRPTPAPSRVRGLRTMLSPDDMFAFDDRMRELITATVEQGKFDLIWISGWDMLVYVPHLRGHPVLGDVVDDGVLQYFRATLKPDNPRHFLVLLKRLIQNYRFERRYFPQATVCNVVSETDAEFARRVCRDVPVTVVHNGVDTEFFRPLDEPTDERALIFEGSMRFPPNVDAVVYFCRKILPRVRREVPGVKFWIVGRDPTESVLAQAADDVVVTGFVDDVRDYLARAAIFVCPMRQGAGIKNKILQAWAMAKPVITTPEGCGGLRIDPGNNVIVAKGTRNFADAVSDLLRNPAKRERLGRRAHETISGHYTWDSKADELEQVFRTTIDRHRTSARYDGA
jgi:glycosyltransferase involved in cell wall biosynthesis